ncbi:MAG: hypothetical protein RL033_3074 [Pseudomonadota bacterium]
MSWWDELLCASGRRQVLWRASAGALAMACACAEGPAALRLAPQGDTERVEAVTRALVLTASDACGVSAGDSSNDSSANDAATPLSAGDANVIAPSCCVASDTPGCADPQVAGCLCQIDPFCCNERHDPLCVREAVSSCGLSCAAPPTANDCCSASATPGCSEAPVLACVCGLDPACCQLRFDQSCVNLAAARCGAVCADEESP